MYSHKMMNYIVLLCALLSTFVHIIRSKHHSLSLSLNWYNELNSDKGNISPDIVYSCDYESQDVSAFHPSFSWYLGVPVYYEAKRMRGEEKTNHVHQVFNEGRWEEVCWVNRPLNPDLCFIRPYLFLRSAQRGNSEYADLSYWKLGSRVIDNILSSSPDPPSPPLTLIPRLR